MHAIHARASSSHTLRRLRCAASRSTWAWSPSKLRIVAPTCWIGFWLHRTQQLHASINAKQITLLTRLSESAGGHHKQKRPVKGRWRCLQHQRSCIKRQGCGFICWASAATLPDSNPRHQGAAARCRPSQKRMPQRQAAASQPARVRCTQDFSTAIKPFVQSSLGSPLLHQLATCTCGSMRLAVGRGVSSTPGKAQGVAACHAFT
jgi:hypothetical protein